MKNEITPKEKDEVLYEITSEYPDFCNITDYRKCCVVKDFLIPDGLVGNLIEYDQDSDIACIATQKGVDFITRGAYTKSQKQKSITNKSNSIKNGIKAFIIAIITAIAIAFVLHFLGLKG